MSRSKSKSADLDRHPTNVSPLVMRNIAHQGLVGGESGVWECGCWMSATGEMELCIRHIWMAEGVRVALEECRG